MMYSFGDTRKEGKRMSTNFRAFVVNQAVDGFQMGIEQLNQCDLPPGDVAIVSVWTTPASIFAISAGATLVAILLALVILKGRSDIDGRKEQVQSITSSQ